MSSLWRELSMMDMSLMREASLSALVFFFLMLNSLASWSDSAAFLSHQYMNSSMRISISRHRRINISGMMPMKPVNEPEIMAGSIWVESLMAVGEKSIKTPILQMSSSSRQGMILKIMEGMERKCFWSSLGPQAQKQELRARKMDKTPRVENTCWKYPSVLLRNKQSEESKNGSRPVKLSMLKQGVAPAKQKNWQMQKCAKSSAASVSSWKAQMPQYLPWFLGGRLLMPPLQIERALVTQIMMAVSQPVRSRARKREDCTQVSREQSGLQMGSKLSLMQRYSFWTWAKDMSFLRKNRGSSVSKVVLESSLESQSTRCRVVVVQWLRTIRMAIEFPKNGRKKMKMQNTMTMMILKISLIFFSRDDISVGMGAAIYTSSSSSCLSFSFSSSACLSSACLSSSLRFFSRSSSCSSSSSIMRFFFSEVRDFSLLLFSLDHSLISSLSFLSSLTSSIMTANFSMSLRLISLHLGLLAGFWSRHRLISAIMPSESLSLLRTGFLAGSKMGTSRVRILCRMSPNDQVSIFSLSILTRFSGRMIFSFISGAQQSMLFLSSLSFFSHLSVISWGSPITIRLLCTQRDLMCSVARPLPWLSDENLAISLMNTSRIAKLFFSVRAWLFSLFLAMQS